MAQQLILVDGSAFLFRSYFSTLSQNLSNDDGFPTGAMFGVINAIKHLQRQYNDAKIIMIFDAKGSNFRHEIYSEYKAHRKPADDDLIVQIEPLYKMIRAMGFHFLCVDGVEADDVIATLATQADAKNTATIIASGDKDLFQLVSDNVKQLDMKGKLYDCALVKEKMGVEPHQVSDLLALTGDTSDNIPGVPSVGPKTAAKWLDVYNDLAGVKANADKVGGKVGEKLRDSFDLLDLSNTLVQLKFDVEIPIDIFSDEPGEDRATLASLYQEYGFSMWLRQLGDVKVPSVVESDVSIEIEDAVEENKELLKGYSQNLILSQVDFDNLLSQLLASKSFVFDLETNSLDYMEAQIVGFVFLIDKQSYYLPVAHDYIDAPAQLSRQSTLAALKPILENAKIGKIGQNLKYDAHVLANVGVDLNGIEDDTMVKSYCLNSVADRKSVV